MKNKSQNQRHAYYNQFIDVKDIGTMRHRQKHKNFNSQAIKITSHKLPYDFFRPYTRQNQTLDVLNIQHGQKQSGLKTPCFGEERRQAHSLSLIPRDKKEKFRFDTLPVQQKQSKTSQHEEQTQIQAQRYSPKFDPKQMGQNCKNYTQRNIAKNEDQQCKQQYSYRQLKKQHYKNNTITNYDGEYKRNQQVATLKHRDLTHRSTERQKIRYHKKLTLNDQLKLDIMKNMEYQNRIRLNINKFFKDEPTSVSNPIANSSKKNANNFAINRGTITKHNDVDNLVQMSDIRSRIYPKQSKYTQNTDSINNNNDADRYNHINKQNKLPPLAKDY